jgi:N-methylhydantoinase A/oxoprolinase/acetone carboxylase beta subunit
LNFSQTPEHHKVATAHNPKKMQNSVIRQEASKLATHFLLELRSVPPHAASPDSFPLATTIAANIILQRKHRNNQVHR